MATVFDLGLLEEFTDIFAWVLIFVVVYGILLAVKLFESRGINALIAAMVMAILGTTSGATGVISQLLPWFVITGFFIMFLLVLTNFLGISTGQTVEMFGGKGVVWWVFVPLTIGLIIALVAGGQLSRGETQVDPETGEEITTPGSTVVGILTDPKILGLILILSISAVTVALMAGRG